MSHPEHDCENCGVTHFAYSAHVEFANRERSKRVSIFGIFFTVVFIGIITGILFTFQPEEDRIIIQQDSYLGTKTFIVPTSLLKDKVYLDEQWVMYDEGNHYSICERNPTTYTGCFTLMKGSGNIFVEPESKKPSLNYYVDVALQSNESVKDRNK